MRRGFTLIELAIAVAIIGLLVAGSFQAMKSMRQSSKLTESKEILSVNKNSIIGYVQEWPNLPSKKEFNTSIMQVGSLQIPLFYAVDTNLANYSNDICAFSKTNLAVVDYRTNRTTSNVAFVLAHGAANGNVQTALDTTTTPQEVRVHNYKDEVDDNKTHVNRVERYDDIVAWVTLNELKQSVDCPVNHLKILNDYVLPRGLHGLPYYPLKQARIYAEGGSKLIDGNDDGNESDYWWCLQGDTTILNWMNSSDCDGTMSVKDNCLDVGVTFNQCTTPTLSSSSEAIEGVYKIDIYLRDELNTTIFKSMVLTIDSNVMGGAGGTGGALLPSGASCSLDSECASGNCLGNGTCH